MATIKTPGKFEGEPEWLPSYWDDTLNGFEDEILIDDSCETPFSVFKLDTDDKARLGEDYDESTPYLIIWEDGQGFVRHRFASAQSMDRLRRTLEEVIGLADDTAESMRGLADDVLGED